MKGQACSCHSPLKRTNQGPMRIIAVPSRDSALSAPVTSHLFKSLRRRGPGCQYMDPWGTRSSQSQARHAPSVGDGCAGGRCDPHDGQTEAPRGGRGTPGQRRDQNWNPGCLVWPPGVETEGPVGRGALVQRGAGSPQRTTRHWAFSKGAPGSEATGGPGGRPGPKPAGASRSREAPEPLFSEWGLRGASR